MARLRATAATSTGEVALTTALKTVVSVTNTADRRVAVRGFGVSFDGVSSTAGCAEVLLVIHSSSGTATGITLIKDVRGTTEALNTSGNVNFSAEPITTGTNQGVLRTYDINQMTGYERAFAQDEEIELAGGERFGIQVRASSSVNCHAWINIEE